MINCLFGDNYCRMSIANLSNFQRFDRTRIVISAMLSIDSTIQLTISGLRRQLTTLADVAFDIDITMMRIGWALASTSLTDNSAAVSLPEPIT